MTARKLWGTKFTAIPAQLKRHESKAAAYRYVQEQSRHWRSGALRSPIVQVYVDERDGNGFMRYEQIDLGDFWVES